MAPTEVPRLSFRGGKQSGLFEDLKEVMSWGRGLLGCGPPPNPWGPRGRKHREPWVVSVLGEMFGDRGSWHVRVHGVSKSQTQLSD